MRLVIIGGSDAGIAGALRARELDPSCDVTVVLDDAYPNFSICGIPYYLSGEVVDWSKLAHRTLEELSSYGIAIRMNTRALAIDRSRHQLLCRTPDGGSQEIPWDRLIIATGATPVIPTIEGLSAGLQTDRVFLVHTIADARALMSALSSVQATRALIIGAGYIGLELAEALTTLGVTVAQFEAREHLLATIDPTLAGQLEAELAIKGIELVTGTRVRSLTANDDVTVTLSRDLSTNTTTTTGDIAIVVAGVQPETDLAVAAGARLGHAGAIWVNRRMETGIDGIFAAGDCVITHHQLLGESYLPLGTTAHKQGRIAGAAAVGKIDEEFRGVVGTQVVKVFDQVVARTGLTELEASTAGFEPFTITTNADDHKRYYPGARTISIRLTGDVSTHRLLGIDMLGPTSAAVHKRIDVAATALQSGTSIEELIDLDLAYTPPLGTPWDALQIAATEWLQLVSQRQESISREVALG